MTNLLEETLEVLKQNGKEVTDVTWVGTLYGRISWDDFAKLANDEYSASYGGTEVNDNLLIVGRNWWLERHEYDGSEWWEYKTIPAMPSATLFKKSFDGDYEFNDEKKFFIFK